MKKTVKIRNITLGDGMPKICVPIVAADEKELADQLSLLANAPHDLVEFRADAFAGITDESILKKVLQQMREKIKDTPLLFTYRTPKEGGRETADSNTAERGPDAGGQAYLLLNKAAAETGLVDLVDVEYYTLAGAEPSGQMRSCIRELQEMGVKVVGSSHDFAGTPPEEEMIRTLTAMQELGVDVTKLAVMPHSRQDVVRLIRAAVLMEEQYADRPCVTMSMGQIGMITRMIGCFSGSAITFAAAGKSSAPGQISAVEMARILAEMQGAAAGF